MYFLESIKYSFSFLRKIKFQKIRKVIKGLYKCSIFKSNIKSNSFKKYMYESRKKNSVIQLIIQNYFKIVLNLTKSPLIKKRINVNNSHLFLKL